jgi:hypothetical protein
MQLLSDKSRLKNKKRHLDKKRYVFFVDMRVHLVSII